MAPLDVTVVVPYTGEPWKTLAHTRAIPSAEALGVPVVVGEGSTVAEARNNGLDKVTSKWTIHLDADDELESGYVEAMATGSADVRAPSVRWVAQNRNRNAPAWVPQVWAHESRHDACTGDCLAYGNWIVVGALVRTDIAQQIRWWEEPIFEDWSFWVRCWQAGATFETIPAAVYRGWSQRGGRNTSLPLPQRNQVHHDIATALGLPVPR